MGRPTIADLAKASGVSLSTVNRVLHGTGKVRSDTLLRITDAAETIGFYGIGTLRRREDEARRRYRFGFLLQQERREVYQQFGHGITDACQMHRDARIEAELRYVDDLSPESIAAELRDLGQSCDAIAVVCADHPQIAQSINALREKGVPVVAYITDLSASARAGYVGTDNWKLGRSAAYIIANMVRKSGAIATFIGNHRYQCQDFSDAGFRSYIREHASEMTVLPPLLTNEDSDIAYDLVSKLIRENDEIVGLYVIGGGISGVLQALRDLEPARQSEIRLVCRDVGSEARRGLNEGLICAALYHPIAEISKDLIATMLEASETDANASIIQRIVPFQILTPENV